VGYTRGVRGFLLPAACAAALFGCARPEPPRITPEKATVTNVSAAGIDLRVRLDAYNPNSIGLSAKSVEATVTPDHSVQVGTVQVSHPMKLPAGKHVDIDVPLSIQWSNVTGVARLAQSNRSVTYDVDGTVELGDSLSVAVPFKLQGVVTHEQLVQAALSSIPGFGKPR